jgi:GT2 family glycosyltransferase
MARVLGTLARQTCPLDEVVVVDNGSTDGAPEAAEAGGARVIRMGCNAGFAAAVNRGIRETRGRFVAVVNNDVELAPGYFAVLLQALERTGAWFATGKLMAARREGVVDGTFDVLCRGGCAMRFGHGIADSAEFARPRIIHSAPWTAAVFRASLFEKTGLLEESFESYLEDVDFGARCASLSLEGLYVPEAVAWHQGSATLGHMAHETIRRMSRNQVLLAARWLEPRDLWHIAVAQGLWGISAARHGAFAAWLQGKWEGVAGWRDARSTYSPGAAKVLRPWLLENERIVRSDRSWYWRMYSLLTPGEAL